MITPDLAATLILIAAPIVAAAVGCACGLRVRRCEVLRWVKRFADAHERHQNLRREVTGLYAINEDLSKRIAQYAADEAKRLAPLHAANRKRHDEAQARRAK